MRPGLVTRARLTEHPVSALLAAADDNPSSCTTSPRLPDSAQIQSRAQLAEALTRLKMSQSRRDGGPSLASRFGRAGGNESLHW